MWRRSTVALGAPRGAGSRVLYDAGVAYKPLCPSGGGYRSRGEKAGERALRRCAHSFPPSNLVPSRPASTALRTRAPSGWDRRHRDRRVPRTARRPSPSLRGLAGRAGPASTPLGRCLLDIIAICARVSIPRLLPIANRAHHVASHILHAFRQHRIRVDMAGHEPLFHHYFGRIQSFDGSVSNNRVRMNLCLPTGPARARPSR